jgi:FKBP-type peptidyl-prolyl cis-trans isomerase 2
MKAKNGDTVSVHYKGTFQDGTVFDSSHDRGETIDFEVGAGQMIPGFNDAVVDMKVGETKTVTVAPEEGYGEVNPNALMEFPKTVFPDDFDLKEGEMVQGNSPAGQPMIGKINEIQEETVVVDFNHPMAGRELNFEIELVEIRDGDTSDAE